MLASNGAGGSAGSAGGASSAPAAPPSGGGSTDGKGSGSDKANDRNASGQDAADPDTLSEEGEDGTASNTNGINPDGTSIDLDYDDFLEDLEGITGEANGESGRNSILEQAGFKFDPKNPVTDEGGRWLTADGASADPDKMREIITGKIRDQAQKEGWSAGRTLVELDKVRSGLPRDDQNNIEVAVAFLPFLPAVVPVVSLAARSAATWITGLVVGVGLGEVISNSQDTSKDVNKATGKAIPVPKAAQKTRDDEYETVTVYRVESRTETRPENNGNA